MGNMPPSGTCQYITKHQLKYPVTDLTLTQKQLAEQHKLILKVINDQCWGPYNTGQAQHDITFTSHKWERERGQKVPGKIRIKGLAQKSNNQINLNLPNRTKVQPKIPLTYSKSRNDEKYTASKAGMIFVQCSFTYRNQYSHALLNNRDTFWEMCR